MQRLSQVAPAEIRGKKCLLRLNLDIDEPKPDSFRLQAALPTITFLLKNNCSITILSHRGRPNGPDPKLSLQPAVASLQNLLTSQVNRLGWLENLRFDPREEQNDDGFARELAGRGDFYVNDDFASSHRAHGSLSAIKKFLPAYLGLLTEKEIERLASIMKNPRRPLVFIIGGNKTEEKEGYREDFKKIADRTLWGAGFDEPPKPDVSQAVAADYSEIIKSAGTVVWNGPLGRIEEEETAVGTAAVCRAMAASSALTVAGGGSLVDFIIKLGLREKVGYLSTGGGAMLAFLAGRKLPGLEMSQNHVPGLI